MENKEEILILIGSIGSGKKYFSEKLIKEKNFKFCKKITTNQNLKNSDYFKHIDEERFKEMISSNEFVYWCYDKYNNYKGILKKDLFNKQILILDKNELELLQSKKLFDKNKFLITFFDISKKHLFDRLRIDNITDLSLKKQIKENIDFYKNCKTINCDLKINDPSFTYKDLYDIMD